MSAELHIRYSELKGLVPIFPLVKQAAELHTMNEYDGAGEIKDPTVGRRKTRAQYLDFGRVLGIDKAEKLITDLYPSLRRY